MSALEIGLALSSGVFSAAGAVWWLRGHTHSSYVTKDDFHAFLDAYHGAVLRELAELRADLRSLRD